MVTDAFGLGFLCDLHHVIKQGVKLFFLKIYVVFNFLGCSAL